MKALFKFNITILLSFFVVLPISNSIGNITNSPTPINPIPTPLNPSIPFNPIPTPLNPSIPFTPETIFYSFAGGTDGELPVVGLIQASDGNFYGTTLFGGNNGVGTVFKISLQGQKTVLHSFAGGTDGATPRSALIQASDGNFYGTTLYGGNNAGGTVFKITPTGVETILYGFAGGTDGATPNGLIQTSDGNFYGTTSNGGFYNDGTIFTVTPQGQETILHNFYYGNGDGKTPNGLIQASDGNFYGTTYLGGANNQGTIFTITLQGQETVLHSFGGGTDGECPNGLIQASNGNFYGTTVEGGTTNLGTVFKVTPQGQETVLYSFAGGTDGELPSGALIKASDGNFLGITQQGGAKDYGTVFKVTPQGKETVLHSFNLKSGGTDGATPKSALIQASDGNLYGTTLFGGSGGCTNGCGTVFKLSINQ